VSVNLGRIEYSRNSVRSAAVAAIIVLQSGQLSNFSRQSTANANIQVQYQRMFAFHGCPSRAKVSNVASIERVIKNLEKKSVAMISAWLTLVLSIEIAFCAF
jgi:hypothetical protein